MNTAVLFLVFNRPDTTAQVFAAIRAARPSRLYVAADGPRIDRPGEAEACALVREIATAVDWPCELRTLFRDANLGCGLAVSSAISWFFENEAEGIILEDDCLPNESFFEFCSTLLKKYRNDPRIGAITGSCFARAPLRRNDYTFTFFPCMWGWATWARSWQLYEYRPEEVNRWREQTTQHFSDHKRLAAFWRTRFDELKFVDTWDYQWTYCFIAHNLLCVTPHRNLIQNVGFDARGTHLKAPSYLESRRAEELSGEIRHPKKVVRDLHAEKNLAIGRWLLPPANAAHSIDWVLRALYIDASTYSGALVKEIWRRLSGRLATRSWLFHRFRLVILALRRKFSDPFQLQVYPGVLVVSPGGVATTMLIQHISRFSSVNCKNDSDGLKHLPHPPRLDSNVRVLFIYGDVETSCRSIVRRGWLAEQSAKLGAILPLVMPSYFAENLFKAAIQRQINRWQEFCKCQGNTMCIHYDELWDRIQDIGGLIGIRNEEFVSQFPARRERISRVQ